MFFHARGCVLLLAKGCIFPWLFFLESGCVFFCVRGAVFFSCQGVMSLFFLPRFLCFFFVPRRLCFFLDKGLCFFSCRGVVFFSCQRVKSFSCGFFLLLEVVFFCKEFFLQGVVFFCKGFERIFRRDNGQDSWNRSKSASYITTGFKARSLHLKGIYRADYGTIDSVLREIYDADEATRSTSSKCDSGLADRVPKRQPDLATRMMLEQASFSSNGDYEQSTLLQLSLDCIDRAIEPITEFVSVRERSMHVDYTTAYEGVWSTI